MTASRLIAARVLFPIFAPNYIMILSMTGYGESTVHHENKRIKVEIKAINSKMGDIRFKMPARYNSLEVKFRRILQDHAHRGKFDVSITTQSDASDDEYAINLPLFKSYYKSLNEVLNELDAKESNLAAGILKIYNVVKPNSESITETEENQITSCLMEALQNLKSFRLEEGQALFSDFEFRCKSINDQIDLIAPLEEKRTQNLKSRLLKNLELVDSESDIDRNRFEQEIVYYLEKLDLTEEKVRLKQHCQFFIKTLTSDQAVKGKSLAFISQEMGREINTMGSKANDHQIQHIVVHMKEELEKIKEQLANVV